MIALIPKLPSPKRFSKDRTKYVGPTDESNWVIQGKLLVGAYPGCVEDEVHFSTLQNILSCKVTTFVSLQREYVHIRNLNGSGNKNNSKYGAIRPYIWDAYNLCNSGNNNFVSASKLRMLHVPIRDCGTTEDDIVVDIATVICFRILVLHEVIYLHCWGGHGRAGTIAAIVLGLLYGISSDEALMRVQLYHDARTCHLGVPSPQTSPQRLQVVRILDRFPDIKLLERKWWNDASKNSILEQKFVMKIMDEGEYLGKKKQKIMISVPSSHSVIECTCTNRCEQTVATCNNKCSDCAFLRDVQKKNDTSRVEIETKQRENESCNKNKCSGGEVENIGFSSKTHPRITAALRNRSKSKYEREYLRPLEPPLSA